MAMNKKKTTTAVVAGITAVALLLGGTFAWTSISQRALNESAGVVNVGGRLHDDFNGTNKDIYVENFTDPLNGGQPIYARIKLTEYMEVGKEAGKLNDDGTAFDESRNAQSVVDGATIDNVDSWSVHKPVDNCAECKENGTLCKFHEHWKWEMGGKTTYMPTFNKDKDSLDADINGTYGGTNKTDKVYYDDYVVYTTEDTGAQGVAFAEKEQTEGSIYSVIGDAQYDNDPDGEKNIVETVDYILKKETHTAKETVEGSVILMKDWNKEAGNFWVYDEDGWAYWANPIMPGESTGLLLDGIEMYKNPGEKCYYSINVVAEFATVGDWEYFTDLNENDNANALEVLKAASGNVTTVTVTNNGSSTVEIEGTATFTATATKASDVATAAEDAFTWAVYDADLKPVTTSTIKDGVLNVGADETNKNLIVAATHTESGAVGLASVAVKEVVYSLSLVDADIAVSGQAAYLAFKKDDSEVNNFDACTVAVNPASAGTVEFVSVTDGANVQFNVAEDFKGQATVTVTKNGKEYAVSFPVAAEEDTIVLKRKGMGWYVGGNSLYRDVVYAYTLVQDKYFVTNVPSANGHNSNDGNNGFAYTGSNGWKLTDTVGEVTDLGNTGHKYYPYITRFCNNDFEIKTDSRDCCSEFTISYDDGNGTTASATYTLEDVNVQIKEGTNFVLTDSKTFELTFTGVDYRASDFSVELETTTYSEEYYDFERIYVKPASIVNNGDGTATVVFNTAELRAVADADDKVMLIDVMGNRYYISKITITE